MEEKIIIGRSTHIDLPNFNMYDIPAKVDTGAYRGALHCRDIRLSADGKTLYFKLLDERHPEYSAHDQAVTDFGLVKIKNTGIDWQERYKIKTEIIIAGQSIVTEMTLADRADMRFPVLIGRKALKKKFLVNVSKKVNLNK
ncbi:MAG: RimK/LysX family protein [Patescibacteria group bacterium]